MLTTPFNLIIHIVTFHYSAYNSSLNTFFEHPMGRDSFLNQSGAIDKKLDYWSI